jgi:hypothetical protein
VQLKAETQKLEQAESQVRAQFETARLETDERRSQAEAEAEQCKNGQRTFESIIAQLDTLRFELARVQIERDSLLASASWRVTRPFRVLAHGIPMPMQILMGKGLKAVWWAVTLQLPTKLRAQHEFRRQVQLLAKSPLFDPGWYFQQNPDVAAKGENPCVHYLLRGAAEGRNPGPDFDGNWYLQCNPDVAATGANPLSHYLEHGAAERREIRAVFSTENRDSQDDELSQLVRLLTESSLFDADWYLQQYPEVAAAGANPRVHYLLHGAKEGRNPGPDFNGNWYLQTNSDVAASGVNPLIHYLQSGQMEGRETRPAIRTSTLADKIQARFRVLNPLRTFVVPPAPRRLTVVTDNFNAGFLDHATVPALTLAVVLAQHIGAGLRLVTRSEPPDGSRFNDILTANGITWQGEIEFVHAPPDGERDVAVSENDLFLTTSWCTTRSVRSVVDPSRIIYLVLEDERMSYPYGDDRLRCEETLADPSVLFIVDSELLFEHLTTGPDALGSVRERGVWFERAFPSSEYLSAAISRSREEKGNLLFCATPSSSRDLYWRGLEAIGRALEERILQGEDWEFYFAGGSLNNVTMPGNIHPRSVENLSCTEYTELLRRMDVSLCLVDAPYPSYPMLDLVANGSVVVTNRGRLKKSLARYSENILCAEPTVEGLKREIGNALNLAVDTATRSANYSRNRIMREWAVALEPVLKRVALLTGAATI